MAAAKQPKATGGPLPQQWAVRRLSLLLFHSAFISAGVQGKGGSKFVHLGFASYPKGWGKISDIFLLSSFFSLPI